MSSSGDSKMRENIEATVRSALMDYQEGSAKKDASIVTRTRAPDCKMFVKPASFLASRGMPADVGLSNDMYAALFAKNVSCLTMENTDIADITIDVPARKAAARAGYQVKFNDGEEIFLEVVVLYDLNEDGSKITRIVHFVDSAKSSEFTNKVDELTKKSGDTSST